MRRAVVVMMALLAAVALAAAAQAQGRPFKILYSPPLGTTTTFANILWRASAVNAGSKPVAVSIFLCNPADGSCTDGSEQLAMICQHQTLQPGEACVLDSPHGVGFRHAKILVFGPADVRGSLHVQFAVGDGSVVEFALEAH